MQPVILPVLGANMTHAVVRAWFKREGDPVEVGDPLLEVETDKVNASLEAEVAGVLRRIVAPVGTRVPVLGIVAFVGAAEEPVPPPDEWAGLMPTLPGEEPPPPADSGEPSPVTVREKRAGGRVAASPAARRLARQLGVSLEELEGTGGRGEITRADVERAAERVRSRARDGRLDAAFVELLRRDAEAFRRLNSETKVHLYRQHGAVIGEHVRIDPGAVIIAGEIHIGAASSVSAGTTVICERLRLGRLASLGQRTRIRCRELEIGDALWSKDDVVIGGGGSGEPGARLRAGDACFFGEGSYLNTGHPLTFGDEVCIGSRAMLFTHSHWQSILRNYRSLFGPIRVQDHVFIGNNAFVFPGVTIGAGATVMVNSFVALDVPPNAMVGGVPARVLRQVEPLPRAEQVRLMREHLGELVSVLGQRGYEVEAREREEVVVLRLGRLTAVLFSPVWPPRGPQLDEYERSVVLTFADGAVQRRRGMTVFDLAGGRVIGEQDRVSDEVREFCRRLGIRFRPFAWRYGVGHFEGERFCPRGG